MSKKERVKGRERGRESERDEETSAEAHGLTPEREMRQSKRERNS